MHVTNENNAVVIVQYGCRINWLGSSELTSLCWPWRKLQNSVCSMSSACSISPSGSQTTSHHILVHPPCWMEFPQQHSFTTSHIFWHRIITISNFWALLMRVHFHVLVKIATVTELFPTHCARIWLFSRMDPPVALQIRTMCKTVAAHLTWIWLFVGMNSQMFVQTAACCKAFTTLLTRMWFFARVNHRVSIQIATHSKAFSTVLTEIWLFTRMNSPVNF